MVVQLMLKGTNAHAENSSIIIKVLKVSGLFQRNHNFNSILER